MKTGQPLALALALFLLVLPQSKFGLVQVKGQTVHLGFELHSGTQLKCLSRILTVEAAVEPLRTGLEEKGRVI